MKSILEILKTLRISDYVQLSCNVLIFIILLIHIIKSGKEEQKEFIEFNKWLSENSTKSINGHYLYNHDKTGRLYSISQLREFFNSSKS